MNARDKELIEWGKKVKMKLIERDMSMKELAEKVDYKPQYCSMVVNANLYSVKAVTKISELLGIESC